MPNLKKILASQTAQNECRLVLKPEGTVLLVSSFERCYSRLYLLLSGGLLPSDFSIVENASGRVRPVVN